MSSTVPPQPDDDLWVLLESVADSLSSDPRESLNLLAEASQRLESFAQHEDYGEARAYLEAETSFQLALAEITAANFSACIEHLENAAKGFTELEMEDRANVCGAFQTYLAGVLEIQRQNPARGLELMREAEKALASIGPAGSVYRGMIDHLKPSLSFAAGALAITKRQMTNAQVLITEAARKAETVADTYYKKNPQLGSCFWGWQGSIVHSSICINWGSL